MNTSEDLCYSNFIFRLFVAHSSKRLSLPFPRYVIFYNGKDNKADRWEQRLSDAYEVKGEEPCLELRVIWLNVNYGHNKVIMKRSKKLQEYSTLIHYIRQYQEKGYPLAEAVNIAVDICIKEGILGKCLTKNRGEVCRLLLTEFDEQKFLEQEREVWKEEGIESGIERGIIQGIESGITQGMDLKLWIQIQKKLAKGKGLEAIADELEEEVVVISRLLSSMETDPV